MSILRTKSTDVAVFFVSALIAVIATAGSVTTNAEGGAEAPAVVFADGGHGWIGGQQP